MPQVPYVDYPTQAPSAGGLTPQTINPPAGAFGAGLGEATAGLGREVSSIGSILEKHALAMQSDINEADVNKATTNWIVDSSQIMEKFKTLQGKDATAAVPQFQQDLEAVRQKYRGDLTSPMAQKLFDQQTMRQFGYRMEGAASHAAQQQRAYINGAARGRQSIAIQQAAAADDPREVELHLNEAEQAARTEAKGKSDEAIQAKVMEARGNVWAAHITAQAQIDANKARTLFEKHRGELGSHLVGVQNAVDNNQIQQNARTDANDIMNSGSFEGRLIRKESSNNPTSVNQFGFAGLYQFGAPRLEHLGVYKPGPDEDLSNWGKTGQNAPGKWSGTFDIPGMPQIKTLADFLGSPEAQKKVFGLHRQQMDQEIKDNGFDQYIGKNVNGVTITKNGLYAMLHLGGVGGAEQALSGKENRADANSATVLDYAKMGAGTGEADPINPQSTEGDLKSWLDQAKSRADTAPVPEYLKDRYREALTTKVRSNFAVVKQQTREAENENYEAIATAVMADGNPRNMPKSKDDLPPDIQQRFNLLPVARQQQLNNYMLRMAKTDFPMTDEKMKLFQKIKGDALTGTPEEQQAVRDLDVFGLELPKKETRQLLDLQTQMKKNVEGQTHVNTVLGYANVQKMLTDTHIQKGTNRYKEFAGYLQDALETWKQNNPGKTTATEKDAAEVVGRLTQKVNVPGFMSSVFGNTSQVPLIQEPPPDKFTKFATDAYKAKHGTDMPAGYLQRFWVNEVMSGRRNDPRWNQ